MSVLFCEMRNCIFILLFMMLHNSVHGTISYGRRNRADGFIRDTRIAYACQDSTMNLSCTSSNGVIRIIRANYGRFVLSTCNPWSVTSGWDLQCSARESFTIVAERCDGRSECSIMASKNVFGDPCTSTHKYLEVYYWCERTEATTTSTTTATTTTTEPTTTTTESTEVTTSGCDCYIRGTTTCDVSSRECQCREGYTGTKCDRCAKGFFNFPECTKCECDSSGTLPDVCSTETGVCLCGPNLTPTCDQCLPGFVNYPFCQEDIATKAPSTVEPTDDSPQFLKLSSITPTTTTMSSNGNRYTCMPEKANGIWWPESMPGIVEMGCPEPNKGKMTWKCTNKGWKRKPNLSNCVSPWLDNLEDLIEASPNVEEVASTLHDRTSNTIFSAGDLKLTSLNLFPKLNRHFRTQVANFTRHQRKIKVKQFSESVLKTGSNLLRHPDSWKTLPTRERTVVATSLVVNMEETAFQIADSLDVGDPNFISRDTNIFMEINAVKVEEVEERKLNFPSSSVDHTGDRVTIPLQSLKTSISEDELRIVFLVYKNLAEFMSPVMEGAVDSELLPTNEPASNETQPYISTNIFSASVNGRTTKIELSQPLLFTLKHNQVSSSEFKPVCSYWHFNETLAGHWSSDGCKLVQTNSSHTTCQCDHMTNFAVLMDVVGTKLSIEEQTSLTAITYFGCIISITCLLCCLFTFCFFKNLQCDRNTIHKNLCLMLMLAEVVFIVGINLTQYKILCAVVAGSLHFLFLAAFSWMCLEGVQLYVMLIEVFEAERSRRLWYYLFGYGVPAVIVAVSAGVHHEGYGTENHCWLNTENYFIWSFVGPVVAVLAVNIVMLGIAVYMMCRHANTLASSLKAKEKTRLQKISGEPNSGSSSGSSAVKDKSHLNPEIPSWLKGAVVLVVLLGLTWSFGVMFVSKESVVMAYLFTILNTLQGVFIFVFHCVMNEKVKKEYKKFAYRATWLPGCIRNILTGYSGSLATSPHNSSSSGGVLLKFWSGRRRRKSSTSTAVDKSSSKGKKRRSDLRSSEVESFSNSNSNHGPIYRPPSNNNGYTHGYLYTNNATGGGIVGDLSVADCSVIDSEYVTEYLHNHMKVSMEKTAYSSDSEEECAEENIEHKNRLSILSEDSAVKNSDFVSTEAELSYSEMSEDESDKSKTLAAEMKPLFSKTYSEKNLLNNLVNSVDVEQKKCPSSNELRLVNMTADSMTRSTPNMKLIEGYESILNSADVLLIENEDEATKGRKSVTRMSSDCPVKSNPHRYVLDYSEC